MSSSVLWKSGRFHARWNKGGTYTAHEYTEPNKQGIVNDVRTRQFDKAENAISAAKRWERQSRIKPTDEPQY
jgi:hypothetical protein